MDYKAEIPYGAYWSTPFVRWQGSFSHLHSIEFAAHVTRQALARRNIAGEQIDYGVLGMSVPQKHALFVCSINRIIIAHFLFIIKAEWRF